MRGRFVCLWLLALFLCAALVGCGGSPKSAHPQNPHFGMQIPKGDYGLTKHSFSAVPSISGYDAVTLANIPRRALVVGCYASGRYANCGPAMAAFPFAHIVSIATWAGVVARCLDVEPGDAVPSQSGQWVHLMYYTYRISRPCVYSNASEMGQVRASLIAWGVLAGTDLWLADWDGIPVIPSGYAAKQWLSGCCVDRDTFAVSFFVSPPKPKPPPPRIVCFGPRAQLRNATCRRVRPEVAKWSRARDASARSIAAVEHGLRANRCRTPYRRDICVDLGREILPVLRQREHYFAGLVSTTLRMYG